MEFKQNLSEIEISGDVQNNKVSIDTRNIDFIVTILSTNLYSNPIQSFIRETVSNAWDSHIEANIDKPVVVEIGTDTEGQDYCKVQDFGVGISEERFNTIYRNIGSSTKRGDNSQIGGFGIGRFSALAYSDVVYITSIHNGIEYRYLMYKDGNSISIDLLHKENTPNPNGVSIMIPIKSGDTLTFIDSIKNQLLYFENLYLDVSYLTSIQDSSKLYEKDVENFNKLTIKKYNSFYVNSLRVGGWKEDKVGILLGKVRYPLRFSSLKKSYDAFREFPIALKFDIGEIEVTPNREEILYTDKNINLIQDKFDASINEIHDIVKEIANKDYDNVGDYIKAIESTINIPLLQSEFHEDVIVSIKNINNTAKLNGIAYNSSNFLGIYHTIMEAKEIPFSHFIMNDKVVQSANYYERAVSLNEIKEKMNKHFLCRWGELNLISKAWVRENLEDNTRLILPPKSLKRYLKKYLDLAKSKARDSKSNNYGYSRLVKHDFDKDIFKILIKYVVSNASKIKTISDSSIPQDYIDKKKAEAKLKRGLVQKAQVDWKQNMNLYPLRISDRGYNMVTYSPELNSLEEINSKYKKFVIYSEKEDASLRSLFQVLANLNKEVSCVEVAPTKIKLLKNIPNFIPFKDFMKNPKYRIMRDIATAYHIKQTYPSLKSLNALSNLDVISEDLTNTVETLFKFQEKYLGRHLVNDKEEVALLKEIYDICIEKNYFNFNILGLLKEKKKLLDNSMFLINFSHTVGYTPKIPDNQINNLIDYIMARKLFIPNRNTLKNFRLTKTNLNNESN